MSTPVPSSLLPIYHVLTLDEGGTQGQSSVVETHPLGDYPSDWTRPLHTSDDLQIRDGVGRVVGEESTHESQRPLLRDSKEKVIIEVR